MTAQTHINNELWFLPAWR